MQLGLRTRIWLVRPSAFLRPPSSLFHAAMPSSSPPFFVPSSSRHRYNRSPSPSPIASADSVPQCELPRLLRKTPDPPSVQPLHGHWTGGGLGHPGLTRPAFLAPDSAARFTVARNELQYFNPHPIFYHGSRPEFVPVLPEALQSLSAKCSSRAPSAPFHRWNVTTK